MFKRNVDSLTPFLHALPCVHLVFVAFISLQIRVVNGERISPGSCLIWGPGLDPDVVLPVRYFFIQAVDFKGENLTLSPGTTFIKIHWREPGE